MLSEHQVGLDKFDSLKFCGISLALVYNIYQDRLLPAFFALLTFLH